MSTIESEKPTLPCQMTIEELKAEVKEAEKEIAEGKGITHEEFIKEIEQSVIDYENGLCITHEEFIKKHEKWL